MEKIKLSAAEKADLKQLHRTIKDRKSGDRIKAILMLDAGYSCKETAEVGKSVTLSVRM